MSHKNNVSKWATILQGLTIAGMVLLPVAVVGALLTTPVTPQSLDAHLPGIAVSPDAIPGQMWGVVALNLLAPLILLATMNAMRKLFGHYRAGRVLTDGCARLIQQIGYGFLALALVPFVLHPVQSVLLSWANPPGGRALSIGVTSDMMTFALAGGLIIVIGWAMRDASDVAAENRSFV